MIKTSINTNIRLGMNFRLRINKELIYLLVLFVFSFWQVLASSLLYFYTIHKIIQIGIIAILSGMLIIRSKFRLKYIIYTTIILMTIVTVAYITDRIQLVISGLLITNSLGIDFKKIVKTSCFASMSSTLCVILASIAGIIPNRTFFRENGIAFGYGFLYYSTYPYIIMFAMLEYMYFRKKLSWIELFVFFVINNYIYKISTLRLTYYLSIVIIILYVIIIKFKMLKITGKFMKKLTFAVFPAAFIFTVVCALKYDQSSPVWRALDKVTSNRISLSHEGFSRYNVKLFGQFIETVTMKNGKILPNYFYIDSGFIYSLLGYGILFSLLITILYSLIFHYSCETNNKPLFIWCLAIAAFTVINNSWVNLHMNCMLLLSMPVIKYYLIDKRKIDAVSKLLTFIREKLIKN